MLVHWTTLDFAFPELDYFGYFQNETHWNSKSLLIWMMFRHVGWQVPGLSWFFTSLHSWKSLGCLQVPLVLFSVTWVHWPVCGVAPWLRAPRSLDEARGMKPSKAPRVETYPYGPIPKKLDDDVEEDEHPGKKKKDSDGIWDEGLNMSLRPKKVLKLRIELLMVLILPVIQLSMDCGVSTGILVWFWALVLVFQDVSCIAQEKHPSRSEKREISNILRCISFLVVFSHLDSVQTGGPASNRKLSKSGLVEFTNRKSRCKVISDKCKIYAPRLHSLNLNSPDFQHSTGFKMDILLRYHFNFWDPPPKTKTFSNAHGFQNGWFLSLFPISGWCQTNVKQVEMLMFAKRDVFIVCVIILFIIDIYIHAD